MVNVGERADSGSDVGVVGGIVAEAAIGEVRATE
jgi:hypothetical protein